MPERHVGVRCHFDALRIYGILDVEQETQSSAGAAGQTHFWINRDVVALVGTSRWSVVIVVAAAIAATGCGRARTCSASATAIAATRIAAIGGIKSGTFFVPRSYRQALEDAR